jgi:hypothetical protein
MATIQKEIVIDAAIDFVWDAVRDVGAVHQRLTPGVLTDSHRDGEARVVTFASGLVARELIVTIDDTARRIAYASVGGRLRHHNASIQLFEVSDHRTQLVWITDLLPDEMAPTINGLVEQGSQIMKRTLESRSAAT